MADQMLFTPYSTARHLMGTLATWMDEWDAMRVQAYSIYEQIYWNAPETFRLMARGTEADPIYVPAGRIVVDTTDRYTAAGFGYGVDPTFGSPTEQTTCALAFKALFDRERFLSKFHYNKKYGLIRGDWLFHIVADPLKPEGSRISIYTVDPASVFYVEHPDDPDRIQGVHIIEELVEDNKTRIKRQTYSKGPDPYDPEADDGKIYTETAIFDVDKWRTPGANPVTVVTPQFALPDLITAIPLYHIRNLEEGGNLWGSSELRGHERLMAAMNQGITDEELSLALDGLGMYATNAGPPKDPETNEITNWILGPGRVVELSGPGSGPEKVFFDRVNGIGSVTPYQDHIGLLREFLYEGSGTPAVATGKVDVSVAESGIALAIQMSPMLSKCDVKDQGIRDTMIQMFYDLKFWLQVYEGINTGLALVTPTFGPKLPRNIEEEVKRIIAIVQAGLASADWGRTELAKLGYVFDPNEGAKVDSEKASAAAAADPFATRAAGEVNP